MIIDVPHSNPKRERGESAASRWPALDATKVILPSLLSRDNAPGFLAGVVLICLLLTACRLQRDVKTERPTSPAESHQRMVAELRQISERAGDENIYVGDRRARELRQQVAALTDKDDDLKKWLRIYQLAKVELNLGNEREAIRQYERAYALVPRIERRIVADPVRQLIFDMGVACLRLGETQNCCQRHSPDSCILPIRGQGIHTDPEGSSRAVGYFQELLARTKPDEPMHLATRWLLNLAYMTLGQHPQDVPEEYLIPASAFSSEIDFPRFANVAQEMGLATFSLAGGAIADDFDNDGYLDLIISTSDPAGQLGVFWNQRDGTFSDGTSQAGIRGICGGLNLVQTDYNNDGLLDVYVLRGGWLSTAGRHPNSLLKNNGDRTFTDVTYYAGLGAESFPSQTAAWADYDLDGDLDLYVGNESSQYIEAPCQLFRNNGDGTFSDVAAEAGVTNRLLAKAVAWGDFDADRYPDIYVSNYEGRNRLYRNRGNGTFEDVAVERAVSEPWESFPAWFWDFDNDGAVDILASAYSGGIAEVAAFYLNLPFDRSKTLPRLYRGDGNGGFQDVASRVNLVRPLHAMGANFGDLDNDGFLDCYFGTGWPEYHELMPNVMYLNARAGRFRDVTTAGGFGHLQKGHAVVFADLDNDGDQDIFEQMGGFVPGDRYRDALYENPGSENHWICVKLSGTQTNRAAIGARIQVRIVEDGKRRSIYRHVNSGGSFGANPLRQSIGLGKAEKVESLEVYWPTTGSTDIFSDVPRNRFLKIVEGVRELEVQ